MTLSGRLVWSLWPQRSMKSDWRQSLPSTWRLHSCKRCQGSSCAPTLQVMTQRWWLGKISEASVGMRRYARYVCHAVGRHCVLTEDILSFKNSFHFSRGGVGRGNAMTNWKMSPRSLPFRGDRLSSWRHFWPHFKVGSKVREPRNWPPKLARSKISATTAWLFKTWSQICKIKTSSVCHRPISTPAWSSTGKHSQAVTCFKPLCIFTTPPPSSPPLPNPIPRVD